MLCKVMQFSALYLSMVTSSDANLSSESQKYLIRVLQPDAGVKCPYCRQFVQGYRPMTG